MEFVQIGNVKIEKTACLAPMASVADRAFRTICKRFGAAYVVGEMASANGMYFSDRKTEELLTVTESEQPMAVQIFGDDPHRMALAAKKATAFAPQIIDINMGCPVPKVVNNNAGSALMKSPQLACDIVRAVVDSVDLPVTVKFRKGWTDDTVNAVEFATLMEQSGAAAITIHGRTRKQMYAPPVDLDIIRRVKEAVSIPVIGNGDVVDVQSAVEMYEQTGCDLVMIGRGAYGNPWVFSQIKQYFQTQNVPQLPTVEEKMKVMLDHIALLCEFKGEKSGMREARKHAGWYLKGVKNAAQFRAQASNLNTYADIQALARSVLESQSDIKSIYLGIR